MILGIDHILIAVNNLDQAVATYQRLGFQVARGGDHPKTGTSNALVAFADGTYLELIAVRDHALVQQAWPKILETLGRSNHLVNFAIDADNLAAEVTAIRGRGLSIGDPAPGERVRPDGQRVAWLKADPTDKNLPFLLQDVTPRTLRIALPTEGVGRVLRVGEARIGTRNLDGTLDEFQKLLGMNADGADFELPRGAVQLETASEDEFLQLVLEADNPGELADMWRKQGTSFRETLLEGIGLMLEPEDTESVPIAVVGRAG